MSTRYLTIFLFLLLIVIVVFGCEKSRRSEDTVINGPKYQGDEEIIKAIESAFGLEDALWKNEERIKTRYDVMEIFRQGFSEKMAEKITDYLWMGEPGDSGKEAGMLRAADPILFLPDYLEVKSKTGDTAVALLKYDANPEGPVTWDAYTTKVTLKIENGVWKIYDMESSNH
jgi:hypothetical protein